EVGFRRKLRPGNRRACRKPRRAAFRQLYLAVINKGALAETFVGTELMKAAPCYEKPELYCWHREQAGSNAEVDYVIQNGSDIIPIEVKASKKGSMQSLRQFLRLKGRNWGIRTSLENFCEYEDIRVYPLYAIGNAAQPALTGRTSP
ncbi:MAG: DUF4143 domain-containing protein, partial [Treponema sp.]|nr:DUF4143 domain-containing protein [Treponema sp.]